MNSYNKSYRVTTAGREKKSDNEIHDLVLQCINVGITQNILGFQIKNLAKCDSTYEDLPSRLIDIIDNLLLEGLIEEYTPEQPQPDLETTDALERCRRFWHSGSSQLSETDRKVQQQERAWRAELAAGKDVEVRTHVLLSSKTEFVCSGEECEYDRLVFPTVEWNRPVATERTPLGGRTLSGSPPHTPPPLVETLHEFEQNLCALSLGLTKGLTDGLPVVYAGGCVLAALHQWPSIKITPTTKRFYDLLLDPSVQTKQNVLGDTKNHQYKNKLNYVIGSFAGEHVLGFLYSMLKMDWVYKQFNKSECVRFMKQYEGYDIKPNNIQQYLGLFAFINSHWYGEAFYPRPLHAIDSIFLDDSKVYCNIGTTEIQVRFRLFIPYLPVRGVAAICAEYVGAGTVDPLSVYSYTHPRARALRSFRKTDIDLFLTAKDPEQAIGVIRELHRRVSMLVFNKFPMVRTKNATTFMLPKPYPKIQIIHRLYQSVGQVLLGFDVDCCALAYTGREVLATPRGLRALETRQNIVDVTRQSTTYEARLFKYARRGFAVAAPGLNIKARHDAARPAVQDFTGTSITYLVGANRLVGMFLVADTTIHTRVAFGGHTIITKALGIVANASDYDQRGGGNTGVPNLEFIGNRKTSVRRAQNYNFAYGTDIDTVLSSNRIEPPAGQNWRGTGKPAMYGYVSQKIEFQTRMPHIQDRVDTLATGSFNPLTSDWYEGR